MWLCGFVVMGFGGFVGVDLEVKRDDSAFERMRRSKKSSSWRDDRVVWNVGVRLRWF